MLRIIIDWEFCSICYCNLRKEKFGDCKEKEVMSIELREGYTIVNYKTIFSQMTDPLLMRVVLMKENGSTCVAGLWFNQLKLVGHTDPNPFK